MKKQLILTLFITFAYGAFACTNLIVGKKASTDGSVMCTYNCDGFGFAGSLGFFAPGMHPDGEMLQIRSWGPPQKEERMIKQVPYTFGVVALMNDHQVSIVETTWDGRKELHNPEGWLDYFREPPPHVKP